MIELTREQRKANNATHGKQAPHKCPEDRPCMICEGGLFICADCGAAEIECEEMSCEERQKLNGTR